MNGGQHCWNPIHHLLVERLTLPQRGREAYGLSLLGWWLSAGVNCSTSWTMLILVGGRSKRSLLFESLISSLLRSPDQGKPYDLMRIVYVFARSIGMSHPCPPTIRANLSLSSPTIETPPCEMSQSSREPYGSIKLATPEVTLDPVGGCGTGLPLSSKSSALIPTDVIAIHSIFESLTLSIRR